MNELQFPFLSILLMFFITNVLSLVPPPTNLSLSCRNFKNVLYWNYSEPSLRPVFTVTIRCYGDMPEGEINQGLEPRPKTQSINIPKTDLAQTIWNHWQLVRTIQNHLDISSYTQNVHNAYHVSVVAQLNGSDVYSSHTSTQFTYGKYPSKTKCVVDFPPLNISIWSHNFEIKFYHPFYIYGIEKLNYTFLYEVEYNKTESEHYCFVEDWICTEKIYLPESLYGGCMTVDFTGSIEGIHTNVSRNICSTQFDPIDQDLTILITALVCSGIIIVMIILVGGVLYKKRTKIMSQSSVLSKILSMGSNHVMIVPEEPVLSPVVSVSQTPLLETPDSDVLIPFNSSNTSGRHSPIRPVPDMESQGSQEPEGMVDEDDIEDNKSSTGYDCGKFPVVMSPGDTVDAYGPRQT